jgi:hypothetical protein
VLGAVDTRRYPGPTENRGWYGPCPSSYQPVADPLDVIKVRRAMAKSLEKAAHKIISIVNRDKDHIPPITTAEANPFPYHIVVNPKAAAETDWRPRIGLF